MTVGQRIMQKRKEMGLSQEALGAELGVSRQAIYKWESDSSLPEIEKLVALSSIFSVTVGWLLGVEEEAAGDAEPAGSQELTESQIRVVEEIVSRYQAAPSRQEEPKKRRRRRYAAGAVLILIMSVFLIRLSGRMKNLQNNYNALQSSVNHINLRVGDQINAITMQVESMLSQFSRFTIEQGSEIQAVDFQAGTVTFSVYAVPKTFVDGMTAQFTARWGGQMEKTQGVLGTMQKFSGTVTVPLTNERVELSVTFTAEGRQELQPIMIYQELYDLSFPCIEVERAPLFVDIREDHLARGNRYDLTLSDRPDTEPMPSSQIEPDRIRLGVFADGKLVQWMEPAAPAEGSECSEGTTLLSFRNPENIRLDRSKTYVMAAVGTDCFGRETVVPGIPAAYSEQQQDWSLAEKEPDGFFSYPGKWEY